MSEKQENHNCSQQTDLDKSISLSLSELLGYKQNPFSNKTQNLSDADLVKEIARLKQEQNHFPFYAPIS